MSLKDLLYEDDIKVSSWHRSLPLIMTGVIVIFAVYFLMPFPSVTIYDTLYNILFSVSIGLVIIAVGVYIHIKYRHMRFAVTEKNIIVEYGRERRMIPLTEVTSIKKIDKINAGRKLRLAAGNMDKIIVATIRDKELLEIYQSGHLAAVITPADNDEFLGACGLTA